MQFVAAKRNTSAVCTFPCRVLAALPWLLLPAAASAFQIGDLTWTIEPAVPAAGQPVRVRLDGPRCLQLAGGAQVDVARRAIAVVYTYDDGVAPVCPPLYTPPQLTPIGTLPRGTYTVEFIGCTNAPPPLPPCQRLAVETLQVGGGDPVSVPALAAPAVALLGGAMLLSGAWGLRRRSRRHGAKR